MRRSALLSVLAIALVSTALALASTQALARKKKPTAAQVRADGAPDIVTYGRRDDVMRFGAELAERRGLDPAWVQAALQRARFQPSVAKFIMPAPAGTAKNWAAYRSRFVEPIRIRAGVTFWRANEKWLALAALLERLDAQRYGPHAAAQPDPALTRHFTAQAKRLMRGAQAMSLALIAVAVSPEDAAAVDVTPAPTAASATTAAKAAKAPAAKPIKHVKRRAQPARKASVRSDNAPDIVTYGRRDDLMAFGAEVATRRGLDVNEVQRTLAQARLVPSIVKAVMPPPAGTAKNWAAYRARFVEPKRIAAGVAFWQANEAWLTLAEQRYGVPPEIVVGIVGVETLYGQHMGNYRVIDALATLGFDFPAERKDRSAFFRDELEQLLVMTAPKPAASRQTPQGDQEHSGTAQRVLESHREGGDPLAVKGSYAGALGMPQFMPSSVNKYAVDFDGNGHIDLHASTADVIGSVAHYLAEFGWQRGLPTHFEVAVPSDASERALLLGPDILPTFTARQFIDHGAVFGTVAPPLTDNNDNKDSNGRDSSAKLALVELQNGPDAPSYVAGTTNFYAVTRYNWSSYYAMAVIELGQAVRRAR